MLLLLLLLRIFGCLLRAAAWSVWKTSRAASAKVPLNGTWRVPTSSLRPPRLLLLILLLVVVVVLLVGVVLLLVVVPQALSQTPPPRAFLLTTVPRRA